MKCAVDAEYHSPITLLNYLVALNKKGYKVIEVHRGGKIKTTNYKTLFVQRCRSADDIDGEIEYWVGKSTKMLSIDAGSLEEVLQDWWECIVKYEKEWQKLEEVLIEGK